MKLVAGVDPGATGVRVAIVAREANDLRLRALAAEPLPAGAVERGKIREPATVGERLRKALAAAEVTAGRRVDEIVLALAGDDLRTLREVTRNSRPPGHPIDILEVDRAIAAAARESKRAAVATFSEEPGLRRVPLRAIGAVMTSVGLDGRGLDAIRGQRGSLLEAASVAGVLPVADVATAEASAAQIRRPVRYVAAPLALATLFARTRIADAIVIDGGAETTGIAVLRGGAALGSRSISIGYRSFERRGENDRLEDLATWARCVAIAARDIAEPPLATRTILCGGLTRVGGTREALRVALAALHDGGEPSIEEPDPAAIGAMVGAEGPALEQIVAIAAATVDLR